MIGWYQGPHPTSSYAKHGLHSPNASPRSAPSNTGTKHLGLSFWHSLADRLGINDEDHAVAPLASMVAARA
ncbi:hypothetical protein GFL78_12685 [Rhizobium leguminosarum bv. viciae]|nr:hypothetical protein [Rhizobium leguminosarum bv. viciae]NKL41676.1 hypothetical protein [Rhizobium leguminosarum bv. viciae]TCA90612.1 hypothetical protein E0H65_24665 [Rhizobium leguminosarum bv. viciae]